MHQDGTSFLSTCRVEVPVLVLLTKVAEPAGPGNSTLPCEQLSPLQAEQVPHLLRRGQPKPGEPQQGARIPQFRDGDKKLSRGTRSRNCVLSGKISHSGEQNAGLMAAELREQVVTHCEKQRSLPHWKYSGLNLREP